ncbi:MAG: hypothetical protein ACRDK0_09310 [Solirubrobacteraceae bacterium]
MAHLVALITDPELAAELVAVAETAGHDVDVSTGEPDAWEACEERTDLLVVDISSDLIDGVTPDSTGPRNSVPCGRTYRPGRPQRLQRPWDSPRRP